MKIHVFTFNPFQENTYIAADASGTCVIIDPGMMDAQEDNILFGFIEQAGYTPKCILNTHCHLDHILGNKACRERYSVPLIASRNELPMLERAPSASLMWGVPYRESPLPDQFVSEGDVVTAGDMEFSVLDVPGHSPGHVAFVHREMERVFSGDVLFLGSVGRTDLPMSDATQLVKSIREKMYALPEGFVILPGHGPETTVGHEKRNNPFVSATHAAF